MRSADELGVDWSALAGEADRRASTWDSVERVLQREVDTDSASAKEAALRALYAKLADAPSWDAPQALQVFVGLTARPVIRESLLHRNDSVVVLAGVVITACDALIEQATGEQDRDALAVPYLIHALAENNFAQPGSEAATMHRLMKQRLVEAIGRLTDLDVQPDTINVDHPQAIEQFLDRARRWARDKRLCLPRRSAEE